MVGQTLAHFRITSLLGEGGMGAVYLAQDTKLGREVAIKVLPDAFTKDAERLARFEREARILASLEHPNIATLYQIEEAAGTRFLVMELIHGQTLGEVIPTGGMPLERLFEIAVPLADALASAHGQDVVHRDLKPANIMVSDEGRVKILDFGLARHQRSRETPAGTEMATEPMTAEGVVLGTVPYMSPEQIEGRPVDGRSDIFSLGAVLYEMATGERPFQGKSRISTMSAIVHETPARVTELKPDLPRHLGRIFNRTLEKDPRRRYQSALDLKNDLDELWQEVKSGDIHPTAGGHRAQASHRRWPIALGALVLAVLFGTLFVLRRSAPPSTAPAEPTVTQLTYDHGLELEPSLSPDGQWIAYAAAKSPTGSWDELNANAGDFDILLQSVGGETAVGGRGAISLTAGHTGWDRDPDISPDGQQVVFASERLGGGLFVIGITGGPVTRITDFGRRPAWSPDGSRIAFGSEAVPLPGSMGRRSQIWTVQPGQPPELLVEANHNEPEWSPDGRWIVYWGHSSGTRDLWAVPATGGAPHQLTDDSHYNASPVWSADGWLYFVSDRGGTTMEVWRAPIDLGTATLTGAPERLATPTGYASALTISADGQRLGLTSVAVSSRLMGTPLNPTSLAASGPPEPLLEMPRRIFLFPQAVSPDGSRIVFATGEPGQEDLFLAHTDGRGILPLTNDRPRDRLPRWSADGRDIAFASQRAGRTWDTWNIDTESGELSQLTDEPDVNLFFHVRSPDGDRMAGLYAEGLRAFLFDPTRPWAEQEPVFLPQMPSGRHFIPWYWSPDGRWIAGEGWERDGTDPGEIAVYSPETETYRSFPRRVIDWDLRPASPSGWRLWAQTTGGWFEWDPSTSEEIPVQAGFGGRSSRSPDGLWRFDTEERWQADVWLLTFPPS